MSTSDDGEVIRSPRIEGASYLFAIAATCLAVLVTVLLTRWLEDFPLLILLTAVMASSLHGGTGPGLLATALSGCAILGATHFLAAAFAIPRVNLSDEVVRLIIFLSVAGGISTLAGARRRAERERDLLLVRERAAREQAEDASGAKDRLLATVSHELRNPLAAILGWASLLRDRAVDEHTRRACLAIERNAKMQARLTDDLLDVSRFAAGKLQLDVRPLDLVPVIEAALDVIRPAAEAKRVRVHIALDRATGLVNGDPDRLQQVVWNLVSNAIKFTPEEGSVWLALGRVEGLAEVRVSDTGQGVTPESLPRVFEPFWQAVPVANRAMAGLGLGLAIVRHLVELHGGTVVAYSGGIGKGATVRVTIPLAQPTETSSRPGAATDLPCGLGMPQSGSASKLPAAGQPTDPGAGERNHTSANNGACT